MIETIFTNVGTQMLNYLNQNGPDVEIKFRPDPQCTAEHPGFTKIQRSDFELINGEWRLKPGVKVHIIIDPAMVAASGETMREIVEHELAHVLHASVEPGDYIKVNFDEARTITIVDPRTGATQDAPIGEFWPMTRVTIPIAKERGGVSR